MNAYQLEILKREKAVKLADLQSELKSIEWEILGHKSYLKNFKHRPSHPLITALMNANQERLQVRCAIANARKQSRNG